MSRNRLINILLFAILLAAVGGVWAASAYYDKLPDRLSQHETLVFGQNQFVPGSQVSLRVVVRDSKDGAPLPDSEIKVSLRPLDGGKALVLFTGKTDPQGASQVTFRVPDGLASEQALVVETRSSLGSDELERPVTLQRDYRLLVATDKPIYQPGQVIHLRILALSTFDLRPAADQEVELVIADGKGNKVFRKKVTTSEFGAASADFQLASEVNTGLYKISASMGNTSSEKTVTVEYYVLPKFAVRLQTEKSFYLPGEHVKASLQADYFFGKPVGGGQLSIEGYTFDVERAVVFTLQGSTDESGFFEFEFDLPSYIAGSDLEAGLGRFYLQASLTDQAQHTETSNLSFPVSQSSLVIQAIPEGGVFRPALENILYVLTSYPDGTPASANLQVTIQETGEVISIATDAYGMAEVKVTPQSPYQAFLISASDKQGNFAQRDFYFEGEYAQEGVLLRVEKPVYRVGEMMRLDIFTTQPKGTVYLDIIREGQTVSTRSVEIEDGHAELGIDLSADLYGTLELHAYKILRSGAITRDTRLVVVDNADNLRITLGPDLSNLILRPGDPASISVQVDGQDGSGVQAALGIAIVDESVFALAEQDPGFARLYFMLEAQLLTPRYDLHGFSVPELVEGIPADSQDMITAIEKAAQASLAASSAQKYGNYAQVFSLQANSHVDAIQRTAQLQQKFFTGLTKTLFGSLMLLPVVVIALSAYALKRQQRLGDSLALAFGLVLLAVILFFLVPLGADSSWAQRPSDRLGVMLNWLSYQGGGLLLVILLFAGLVSFVGLIALAVKRKDPWLGWSMGLLALFIALAAFLIFALGRSGSLPQEESVIFGLLAFLLLPLAFLLRFAGYVWGRQALPALASLSLALFLLMGLIPTIALTQGGAMAPVARNQFGGDIVEEAVGALPPIPAPQATAMPVVVEVEKSAEAKGASAAEPPRLRQYFPETMLWLPDAVTDASGALQLDFDVADSITTWRITALASSLDGRLGSATAGLRVFQDFFIDLDLPVALTAGDEVSIPVGVFNYLSDPQSVQLTVEKMDWFELLDEPSKQMEIGANDISVVYFRVKAVQFGRRSFKVTALGSQMSDAIQKEVRVYPNGKPFSFTQSDRLTSGAPVKQAISIPADAIPGTQSLLVKIYPGILSQVVEGLDSILRMPNGCFEQTSSTTYPNVLVLDYLKTTNQASPETQFKAEEYINLGYQRLATFEVQGSGGFSLFGDAPADRMLTAYGLQEFADMSRVHDVDPALIQRAGEWLLAQQSADGSWENDRGLVHENTWASLGDDRLPVTAYIAWSLVEAGFGGDSRTEAGLRYVRENAAKAEDAYVIALVANALVAADLKAGSITGATQAVLDRLAKLASQEGDAAFWQSGVATFMGSEGKTGSIETTALAALAFLRSGSHPELGNAALLYLVQQKDSFGTWYSTQATVLALKALIQSVRAGGEKVDAEVTITLNGSQTRSVQVTPENFDVVQLVSFDDVNPGAKNLVEISMTGEGNLMYQVTSGYYLPWEKLALYPELSSGPDLVTIDMKYDRTELAVNDTVQVNVTITLNQEGGKAESALIDLGLPPGFSVLSEDLAALVARFNDVPADYAFPTIERYELTGRQILIYISNLSFDKPLSFSYRLRAKFPLVALTPSSQAYDYYNPDVSGLLAPQVLVVKP